VVTHENGKDLYDIIFKYLQNYGLEYVDFILEEYPKVLEGIIKTFSIKNDEKETLKK
jgi:hypothetical protein